MEPALPECGGTSMVDLRYSTTMGVILLFRFFFPHHIETRRRVDVSV